MKKPVQFVPAFFMGKYKNASLRGTNDDGVIHKRSQHNCVGFSCVKSFILNYLRYQIIYLLNQLS
jgi:hypothetical protein